MAESIDILHNGKLESHLFFPGQGLSEQIQRVCQAKHLHFDEDENYWILYQVH